ncbi:MAG: hxuA 4, partial [Rickettsiaceae bacterium]|nr:hxuA 4 [Rickettsiaceae bacterium]
MILVFLTAIILLSLYATIALANPEGGEVIRGEALITTLPDSLVVTQTTDRAVIDWRSFNIEVNQRTHFTQPSKDSITLNRVGGDFVSQIDGSLTANGNL